MNLEEKFVQRLLQESQDLVKLCIECKGIVIYVKHGVYFVPSTNYQPKQLEQVPVIYNYTCENHPQMLEFLDRVKII